MKKISFLIFLLFASTAALFAQDTLTVYYDNNWKEITDKDAAVFYRKAYADSNNIWVTRDYYSSGQIQMTGSYKNKKMQEKQGHFTYYHENGNKLSEGNYVNDDRDGSWTTWTDDGLKKSEGSFKEDENIGVWNYYYQTGQLESTETFVNEDSSTYVRYYKNGAVCAKGCTSYGMPSGTWTYWNLAGEISFVGNYLFGQRTGEWIKYFGKTEMKVIYNFGEIEGKEFGGILRN